MDQELCIREVWLFRVEDVTKLPEYALDAITRDLDLKMVNNAKNVMVEETAAPVAQVIDGNPNLVTFDFKLTKSDKLHLHYLRFELNIFSLNNFKHLYCNE